MIPVTWVVRKPKDQPAQFVPIEFSDAKPGTTLLGLYQKLNQILRTKSGFAEEFWTLQKNLGLISTQPIFGVVLKHPKPSENMIMIETSDAKAEIVTLQDRDSYKFNKELNQV